MAHEFSGRCLCGAVEYACASEPMFQANCHCDDCRRSGGGVYASFVFVSENMLTVNSGELHSFSHETDRGNTATKYFCPKCGSQLFTRNSANSGRRGYPRGYDYRRQLVSAKSQCVCRSQATVNTDR